MFVTNWISTTKIQKISEITNFFRHYFLSRTEVIKYEIALYSVQFANIYKVVAIKYLEKQIWFSSYAVALVFYVKNPNS